jgi:signal transduction histidine kinase
MSQASSADAAPPGVSPGQRGAGSVLAPRNWRMTCRLIALVAIPTVLGLAVTGLRVTDATRSAEAYSQVSRLAVLGQQVTGLAQAMEDERAGTAAFIADRRPAAGVAALHRQYVITDRWAATVRRLVHQIGRGYPAQTRASAATALVSIAELPGLRSRAAQSQDSALAVINGYSAATAGLFLVNDGIADLSGNSALIASVRALASLSGMKDQASQQQAILSVALADGRFGPGALTALTTAQARQAGDLASFRSSATPEENWALTDTLASPLATQGQAVEQQAIAAGNGTLALGPDASQQWRAGMSYTVRWMRHAEQQLAGWIRAFAQSLQRSAVRSARVTGGAALAVVALILLVTIIIARSVVRPLRRLEAAALDVAGTRLPAEVRALGVAGNAAHPLPVPPIDVPSTGEIGRVARAVDRLHREAVRLAGDEARLRGNVSALSAGFFRRSHSLVERLLRLIDGLELSEDDPERLASLFQMDHLATRMRRNSESALVLAGHEAPRHWTEPVTLVDVLRAAVSEIEQYNRVILDVQPGVSVSEGASADTVHLLAELLENATMLSPETSQVVVSGHTARGGGSLITITDGGMGMPEEHLRQINRQLADPPLADVAVVRHMGLFAVAHLAARHGIKVKLLRPPDGGTTAEVYLPAALISQDGEPGAWLGQAGRLRRAAGTGVAAADPLFSAPRFAAGPEPAREPETGTPDAVALTLGAPLPSLAQDTSFTAIGPEPGAEPGGALPIFESVESDYSHTLDRRLPRPSEQPGAAAASWASAGDGGPAADRGPAPAVDGPAVNGPASAGLPQRTPHASLVRAAPVDKQTRHGSAAESAEITRDRLASFQRGSRRARAAARMDRTAKQPAQDG